MFDLVRNFRLLSLYEVLGYANMLNIPYSARRTGRVLRACQLSSRPIFDSSLYFIAPFSHLVGAQLCRLSHVGAHTIALNITRHYSRYCSIVLWH